MAQADEILKNLADLYAERNKTYGSNYKEIGHALHVLFPQGLEVNTPEGWNKLAVLVLLFVKVSRLTHAIRKGLQPGDTLDDLVVYGAMLQELYQATSEKPDGSANQ